MAKKLIIVESPTKIKTLKKILSQDFSFESSLGHIRDLPKKGFGIDVENDFEPEYVTMPDKKEVIDNLKKAAKAVDIVYLSPDPDREGEAIAWHIASILPKDVKIQRVTFNEITKDAVLEALKHPREIDMPLVNAQQARRLLDRIVGYKISPILMRRVQGTRDGGLSAGRVQSVALKMVVDREKEIDAFIPVEYWNVGVFLKTDPKEKPFQANLYSVDGKKIEKELVPNKSCMTLSNEKVAKEVVERLKKAPYTVLSVERKEKRRNPSPPFITSTLQQEASRHFGFSASRTMGIAQGLYEGVDLGKEGTEGLITYMRTDSVRLSSEAIEGARKYILQSYGKEFLPTEGRQFSAKKNAQDAHEAIRPTAVHHSPESIRSFLTDDQYKLYSLIWKRLVASQMTPAVYDTVSCDIEAKEGMIVRATGSTLKFQGFLIVYEEKVDRDSTEESSKEEEKMLPNLTENASLFLADVSADQSFTRPPPRFTEASLIKELEKSGIGRPSTYTAIMNKIQSRDYTIKEKGSLKPTELGKIIAQMLEDNFKMIMDIGFTASMENELEHVGENTKDWKELLKEFWKDFSPLIATAEKEAFVPKLSTDKSCPDCGLPLQKIWAKNKYFYGCSNYPTCSYTAALESLEFNKEDYDPNFDWDQKCSKCGKEMKLRFGKYGAFLGCTGYPDCRGIVNIAKAGEEAPAEPTDCPATGCDGKIHPRRSRFGKIFFSCSNYPDCDVIGNSLDEMESKYQDHPKTAYVSKKSSSKKASAKKTSSKKASSKKTSSKKVSAEKTTRKQKTHTLSPALMAIVGVEPLSRPEIVKKLWDYIKAHECQDPKNKRLIRPDAALEKVFGSKDSVDMMKLAGMISSHIIAE
ncbi:MAG: type I DNA topoisomerase [Chlamydiota bacterium]